MNINDFETVEVETDVLIVGGGMAACGTAVEAAYWAKKNGLKVTLVDKAAVDRSGAVAMGLSAINQYVGLKDGEKVLMFPEGQRSWDGELAEGKTGVGLMIAKSRARVLPVRVFGAEEILPRGASFPRRGKVTIVIGEDVIEVRERDFVGVISTRDCCRAGDREV